MLLSCRKATLGQGAVLSYDWDAGSPRETRMSLAGGVGDVQSRVLAAAQAPSRGAPDFAARGRLETRELSAQVVTRASDDGAQRTAVLPSACLSKYKWATAAGSDADRPQTIEAVQRVAIYPDPQAQALGAVDIDAGLRALAASVDAGERQPSAVYKYTLRLTRSG